MSSSSSSPPSRGPPPGLWNKLKYNKGLLSLSIMASLGLLAYAPVHYYMNYIPKFDPDKPMPRSASMRGAYVNTGSRDIGPERDVPRSPKRLVEEGDSIS